MKGAEQYLRFLKSCIITLLLAMMTLTAAAETEYTLPVNFMPGKAPKASCYISDTEYLDPTLHVKIETGRKDNCDYWVARVKIGHASQLRTAAAGGFEKKAPTIRAMSPLPTPFWNGLPKADISKNRMCLWITAAERAG